MLAAVPAMAAEAGFWTPDAALVQKVDWTIAQLSAFRGSACGKPDLTRMSRHYWGMTGKDGHRLIVGELHVLKDWPGETAGIHIEANPVIVMDGGCGRADATYDVNADKLLAVGWGGFA
jgi:hypothetical protein